MSERPGSTSSKTAVETMSDAQYFRWAREEADKLLVALLRKRFPDLVQEGGMVIRRLT